ncbi:lysophospholipase [Novosphingobium kunmingense]|uniref:Lysophospholipase n=1 Tax=Novosphingobium kunmingense TaxID=1211806 RepID=A0A2N0HKN7_9SPHN|nr:alpha/beta hydrolase [Novosphingobium kunmingense]PKB19516.1 lysophospholipase [Novosphingobium kunmingense]
MPAAIDRRAIPADAAESRWSAPDGHAIRRIDWPAANGLAKGSLLFFPGRGDSYEKYLETLDHWAQGGWRVTAMDWRGQAGSGRLGTDPVTGHIDDFATWVSDLAVFWAQWIKDAPGPHVLAGHSMGGHLVLRAAAEGRVAPDGLLLCAPMMGFRDSYAPAPLMHLAAKLMAALGDRRRLAWKWSEKPGEVPADRNLLLTHDGDRYADELWWRAARPELAMGPGSWGWVERAYASMRLLDSEHALDAVTMPVLILAARHDQLVSYKAIDRAGDRLRNCEMLRFGPEAFHEILREEDAVRDRALEACDRFLAGIAAD